MLRIARRRTLSRVAAPIHRCRRQLLRIEELETRVVPSSTRLETLFAHPFAGGTTPALAPFNPSQIRHAYGIDQINFGSIQGDGSGQTIAIVDAYNAPHIQSDLATFDKTFGLPSPPSFKVINESGGTRLPRNNAGWAVETSLDVEWAHATAPKADLLLVEASTNSFADLFKAVTTAAGHSGVSVVSMSFGGGEFSGETSYDSTFTTPSGHQGVSFVASAGDSGAPAQYPSASPNVLSVGGTSLTIDSAGNYISEVGWSNSYGATGGGPSAIETEPAYQAKVQSTGARGTPDVSLVADPNTGVYVYDTYGYSGWLQVGGTSLSAPVWAGLIGIANQGRAANKLSTLTNVPADVYTLPASDFHDITSGNNGYQAGPGYDFVTGLGTPKANLVVPALASPTLPNIAVSSATVHSTATSKPAPPVKTPPPSTTAALFIVQSAPAPFVPASTLAPLATQAAVSRDVLIAQLTAQQLYLATPPPQNPPGRVTISEQTLQLAHSEPDRTDNTSMKPDDNPTDKQGAPSGTPMDLQMDILPLDGLLPGESVSGAPARDFFFAAATANAANFGAALQAETLEQVDDTLEPAVMAGLLLLAGSSWRASVEESQTRRCTALHI
jgi:hypothetical protein